MYPGSRGRRSLCVTTASKIGPTGLPARRRRVPSQVLTTGHTPLRGQVDTVGKKIPQEKKND